jgi:multiple sugar transport system ATP-binding protein
MARVVFDKVSKRFDDDTLALQNFSLTIEDGEMMVLVGPSGCGKSTALRILAGLEHATAGEILINDRMVNHTTPQQRNVAMVFQNYALYPHMSVRANLEFPLRMAHLPADLTREKVASIADILNLSELLERRPKQLSGGQRQRVAMGRALVRDPSVFLLDEPLSNLDAKLRAQIRADIARLQKRLHKTTLYVTHDQVEAMTLGDRVAVMNAGSIQQVGTPDELYQQPQNTFVAKFIGSPGMNIIPSEVSAKSEAGIKVTIGGQVIDVTHSCHGNAEAIKQYTGKDIFIGIRPEAFTCSAETGSAAIRIKTDTVEFLGHESLVYFKLAETEDNRPDMTLIARITGKFDASCRSEEAFYINPGSLYLFDSTGHVIE